MSIKAGQILHDANGFVVDRIQTGGPSNLNLPEERIRETGNFQTVAIIRDIPDLSFELESLDVDTEIEALLGKRDPTASVAGDSFDFTMARPMDVLSPFKSANGAFDIIRGLALPNLTLESAAYRFGTRTNATKTFTLRGDAIYYIPGTPYRAEFTVPAGPAPAPEGPYTLPHVALPYDDAGTTVHVLGLCLFDPATGAYRRLFYGSDYTDTTTDFTLTFAPPVGQKLHAVYGSAVAANYPQTVHQGATVKPAAVRGKDLDVFVDDGLGVLGRWAGVQSFEANWRVTLDNDEEFGNRHYVSQDYDIAEVTGNIVIRARDAVDLWNRLYQITGVTAGEVIGAFKSRPLPLELRVNHPDTGVRMETLYVPDARITVPAIQARVGQKLDVTFPWSSDSGVLIPYKGARP